MSDIQIPILNDLPSENDALEFKPYVNTLADIISTASTPLTIGIFGTWGSGKTSLMKMIKNDLKRKQKFSISWFDAWKYDKEDTLWRAFLLSALSSLRESESKDSQAEDLSYLESMLYRSIEIEKAGGVTIDLLKLGSKVAQGTVQLGLSFIPGMAALSKIVDELQNLGTANVSEGALDAIRQEQSKVHIEQVRFLEQFQDKFKILVEQHVTIPGKRLVVFVDDLDRCLPEKAIEVLEAIKLFVDVPGCIFVLGLDQQVIARGIEIKYKEFRNKDDSGKNNLRGPIDGARYLEKIIQLPFQIPPIDRTDMSDFVRGLVSEWPHEECPRVFADTLGDNPRQVKRTVNIFFMLWGLVSTKEREEKLHGAIKPIRLAKIVAIQSLFPELYEILRKTPLLLRDLEKHFREEKENTIINQVDPELELFVSNSTLRNLFSMHPHDFPNANFTSLNPSEIREYFTLTRPLSIPTINSSSVPHLFFEPEVVQIPVGPFLMGMPYGQSSSLIDQGLGEGWAESEQPQHDVELSEYYIGKHPVTNDQYQLFVDETSSRPPRHWEEGRYPEEKGEHPVVNVTWADAIAYCKWLSKKSGKQYQLPTEAEWEKAARGKDGRIYPWGNEFDSQKCNTKESGKGDTTPVGHFSPAGDSPYGVADMSGNIFEWCSDWMSPTEYETRKDKKVKDPKGPENGAGHVIRGGAYDRNYLLARTTFRETDIPMSRSLRLGFRVVLQISG
ncbi:MAG: hypothetical protein FD146_2055 [Anaerolineaceae bacterium]|nr:MAG: hypothetical protein FD146_2055 [Anaerolineaceae bacterium]